MLFGERIAQILRGVRCPQFNDNVLVGARTPVELMEKAMEVFRRFDDYGVKVNFDKVKWMTEEITFLGYEIREGTWTYERFLREKMEEVGQVRSVKELERVIGIISYARRAIKDVELILGPLRHDLKTLKKGEVTPGWWREVDWHVKKAFEGCLLNVQWLILPGCEADEYVFELETDWSSGHSGYMLFAKKGDEERLIDLGSQAHGSATSSYLGELDTIQWACKRTKALRGDVPLVVRTDNHGVFNKFRSGCLGDADIRAFRRWGWLIENEPGLRIEFLPGKDNQGADLLSRPVGGGVKGGPKRNGRIMSTCNQMNVADMEQEVWSEHLKAHWGPYKVYHALRRMGKRVPWRIVGEVIRQCEVCCHFRRIVPHQPLRQTPYSEVEGHTVYTDVVGPLRRGRGGVRYILSFVDNATRMGMSRAIKVPNSGVVIRGLREWVHKYGPLDTLVSDNPAYYRSEDLEEWCLENDVV